MDTTATRRPDLDRRLTFFPAWGRSGWCRMRLWDRERVVVVSELADNPGPSVTNAIEDIALLLSLVLDRPMAQEGGLALFEHYPADEQRGPTLDAVCFASPRYRGAIWAPARTQPEWAWLRSALAEP